MHTFLFGANCAQKSCISTSSTQVTAPALSAAGSPSKVCAVVSLGLLWISVALFCGVPCGVFAGSDPASLNPAKDPAKYSELCLEGSNNPWEWLHTESGDVVQKLIRHGPGA